MNLIYKRFCGSNTVYYYDDFMALDIETSHNSEYTWISSIQVYFLGEYHLFRKPIDFMEFLNKLILDLNLYEKRRLLCVIHNASYDLSYLIGYFQKYLPDKDDRSCIKRDRNNIICYRQGGLDFRDSYALVNCSLEKWGKDLNIEHQKKVGLYDYNKIIYQDTELSEDELKYDQYDVLSLYECFKKQLEINNDTIASVVYTSTGYTRRDTEKSCRKDKYFRQDYFINNRLNLMQMEMNHKSFAGGYTHNNRFFNDAIICCDKSLLKDKDIKKVYQLPAGKWIAHRDFRSFYPSILRNNLLPLGKPQMIYDIDNKVTSAKKYKIKDVLALWPDYFCVCEIYVESAILKDHKNPMPFLQVAKLEMHESEDRSWCLKDNGRVLSFKGSALLYADNLLLDILDQQYHLDVMITKVLAYKMLPAPKCLTDVIDQYFKGKSDYKAIVKKYEKEYGETAPQTVEAAINLMLSKQRLNSIFGMFCQYPLSSEYDIDYSKPDIVVTKLISGMSEKEKQKMLDDFYSNRHKYLCYQCGIFTTAAARSELWEYAQVIGPENVLYADTDSLFYITDQKTETKVESLNKKKNEKAKANKAFITTDKGEKVYYDVFESETPLKAFKGLHSKCYSYITDAGEFKATIAGVPARHLIGMNGDKPIYITREQELSGISADDILNNNAPEIDPIKAMTNLTEHFIFKSCTGTTCNYSKYMLQQEVDIIIDGHHINTFGGAVISQLKLKQIKNMDLAEVEAFEVMIENG